jgi:vesicle transport protein SEC22
VGFWPLRKWLRTVETVGRQYAFIKFDRVVQKKRRDYSDPNSSANMKKLNDDLQTVHSTVELSNVQLFNCIFQEFV